MKTEFLFNDMKLHKYYWILSGLLICLAVLLWAVILLDNRDLLDPPIQVPAGGEVSVRGPLGLSFSQRMERETIEKRFKIDPEVEGRLEWEDLTLWFWPGESLQPGRIYIVRLEAGAMSKDGRMLESGLSWSFRIRFPGVVYLHPASGLPELWRSTNDGQIAEQLTETGGKIFDFDVAIDGEQIVYSVVNDQDGIDLWMMDRNGDRNRRLLACGLDLCIEADISPDGKTIAYSRKHIDNGNRLPQEGYHIWELDLQSGYTAALYEDQLVTGREPSWSPDGNWLAFSDCTNGGIRVLEIQRDKEVRLTSTSGIFGSWSPDGKRLIYTEIQKGDVNPYGRVYEADIEKGSIQLVLGKDMDNVEYGVPIYSPDGESIVVSLRMIKGGSSKQIWIMRPDGSEARAITSNQNYTYSAYRWDPGGDVLVFQGFELGNSIAKPEVMLWWRERNKIDLLAQDAAFPEWLP